MTATRSPLAEAVSASAEESVTLLLARARLVGLPKNASQALVFGCGSGHTTAALGDQLGFALGIDPSEELVSSAELVHPPRGNCEFAVGDVADLAALSGRFDLILSDLSHRQLVRRRELPLVVSALLSALAPGGIAAIGISARGSLRRRATTPWSTMADGIAAAGGRVTWTSRPEDGTVWVFVRGRLPHLRLLPAAQQFGGIPSNEG